MATAEELLDSKNPSRKVPSATGCWGLRYPSRLGRCRMWQSSPRAPRRTRQALAGGLAGASLLLAMSISRVHTV